MIINTPTNRDRVIMYNTDTIGSAAMTSSNPRFVLTVADHIRPGYFAVSLVTQKVSCKPEYTSAPCLTWRMWCSVQNVRVSNEGDYLTSVEELERVIICERYSLLPT